MTYTRTHISSKVVPNNLGESWEVNLTTCFIMFKIWMIFAAVTTSADFTLWPGVI